MNVRILELIPILGITDPGNRIIIEAFPDIILSILRYRPISYHRSDSLFPPLFCINVFLHHLVWFLNLLFLFFINIIKKAFPIARWFHWSQVYCASFYLPLILQCSEFLCERSYSGRGGTSEGILILWKWRPHWFIILLQNFCIYHFGSLLFPAYSFLTSTFIIASSYPKIRFNHLYWSA